MRAPSSSSVAFAAAGLLAACGGQGAPPRSAKGPVDVARVCAVRPAPDAGEHTVRLHDNGRLVGATVGASYVCWLAAPGVHQITADRDDTGPLLLRAVAGQRYFIHEEVFDVEGVVVARHDFASDDEAEALLAHAPTRVRASIPGHDDAAETMAVVPAAR